MSVTSKVAIAIIVEAVVFVALLFGSAGTLEWGAGWAWMILMFGGGGAVTVLIARRDPALLAERMRSPMQPDQPFWDKVFLVVMGVLWCAWLALMGLDAVRFRWSVMPLWLASVGSALVAVSFWLVARVFLENTFLAPVVKIQKERGHHVVSSGPYAVVRHPLYAAAGIMIPASALVLGSWWGLAASALLLAGLVWRTEMEERELIAHLEGYAEYAQRVRYRLVPFVW
ncbi:methyltransferase family protein [Caballeronia ptereochthonis]|uniref:Isoprenylcysteine carboxyl methyltransferase n=1 Tax=Caballeronia ptereochthonis TaxID=1777144 RepID=A0A157ZQP4_9BURK|nr:isoprenylcysteine carboxylmethyltransferase family protein [Caballeronia ptereochthonis]SAK47806.1 isoprenylcysteine carboxyl methyltransferase [Caballeronia ptereochthonis]